MDHLCITYHIDRQGIVTYLSDGWQAFADENQANHLSADNIINRPLCEFITDKKCQYLYELLIDVVRKSHRPVTFPFRCDSPGKRRYMHMQITQPHTDIVQFESRIIKEETRQPLALLDSRIARSDESITICSFCKKIRISSHEWLEAEEAIQHLRIFDLKALPELDHGICLRCLDDILQRMHRKV